MHILSWNVNGLRACLRKRSKKNLSTVGDRATFGEQRISPEILGLQEVRALPEQLPPRDREPEGWYTAFQPAERKGYSGVALYGRRPADELETSLGDESFDVEGRLQIARFGALWIANVYFPNGKGTKRDNSRVPFKLDFYHRLFDRLEPLKARGERILVIGDFNTAHHPIDLARPEANKKISGFLPEEREELDRWLEAGWEDTFRVRHPHREGAYTWWSNWGNARERNVGWRLDLVYASPGAQPFVQDAYILPKVRGSDHCPAGVQVDPAIFETG